MNIGFIGLGNMGGPMAANLVRAGHVVTVCDVRAEAMQRLVTIGARQGASPKALAAQAHAVFTSLPGPREMEEVALGAEGILAGAHPGLLYIDLSTNSPTVVQRVAKALGKKGAAVLDAPVSGGSTGAASGQLTIMVGGEQKAYERARPLLEVLGSNVMYLGPSGSGCVGKLCNNLISLSILVLLGEAFTLGVKSQMSAQTLYDLVSKSSGDNHMMHVKFPKFLFAGNFQPGFALDLAWKDVRLAVELAKELGVPMSVSSAVLQRYQDARSRGAGTQDVTAVIRMQEEEAGAAVRSGGAANNH